MTTKNTEPKTAPITPEGAPATNNLVPMYSEAPFSMIRIGPQTFEDNIPDMYKLSSVSLTASAQLYCYHENAAGSNDYIVIIITQLDDISNGNPLRYFKRKHEAIGVTMLEWDQYFDYSVEIVALDAASQPFSSGLTIYSSSPPHAGHEHKTITDSVGLPDPFTIFMDVLNSGTWQGVNFPASYTNTIDTKNVKWYHINSLDDQSTAKAGVQFHMPTNESGEKKASGVTFEVISIFRFDGSLVNNGTLPVTFSFSVGPTITQKYGVSIDSRPPSITTSTVDVSNTFNSGTLDLVLVTQNQSPQTTNT